jgi:hypothetical protein
MENQTNITTTTGKGKVSTQIIFEKFLVTYSPNNVRRELKSVTTIQKAVKTKTPTVSKIAHTFGDLRAEKFIKVWLLDLNKSLDVKNPLSAKQVDDIAFYVVNDYRNISLADLNVIFSDAKKGVYGSMYESLSTDKVLGWILKYNHERLEVCAANSYQDHAQQKENPHETRTSETTLKNYFKQSRE